MQENSKLIAALRRALSESNEKLIKAGNNRVLVMTEEQYQWLLKQVEGNENG